MYPTFSFYCLWSELALRQLGHYPILSLGQMLLHRRDEVVEEGSDPSYNNLGDHFIDRVTQTDWSIVVDSVIYLFY